MSTVMIIKALIICCNRPQYGSSRHSYQPMSFKKADGDPYQQSFLLFSSSLTEHCRKDMVCIMYISLYIRKANYIWIHQYQSDTEFFIHCAKSYKLHGLPIHVLCDHNYKVMLLCVCASGNTAVITLFVCLVLLYVICRPFQTSKIQQII